MNKIVENLLEVAFIAVLVRCLILGATPGDAVFAISLVTAICYKHYYIKRNQISDKEEVSKQIEDIKNAVIAMQLRTNLTSVRKSNEAEKPEVSIRRF